uniref:Uncharacterized protein n=1 Tax=Lepeophtheirus salmonis TaxID=72036 RepID=A0A0K2TAK7_LEPSM
MKLKNSSVSRQQLTLLTPTKLSVCSARYPFSQRVNLFNA